MTLISSKQIKTKYKNMIFSRFTLFFILHKITPYQSLLFTRQSESEFGFNCLLQPIQRPVLPKYQWMPTQ